MTTTTTTFETKAPLKILFIPLPSPGHIIPMIDIAKLFASQGAASVAATVVLTPLNAARFRPTIERSQSLNHNIKLHIISFPSSPLLPPDCESADMLPDRSLSEPFGQALDLLQVQFDRLVRSELPDAIVSDLLLPWTAPVAAELGIPRYVFPGTGCFAMSVELSVLLNRGRLGSEACFIVPGLPDTVYLTQSKLAETTLPGQKSKEFLDRAREADLSTTGMVVNSFSDLEPRYAEHYERVTGKQVWMIGPVSLCSQDLSDMLERGRGRITSEAGQVFHWLDSKAPGSVLYVCFGSLCRFPQAQLKEIGFGLEASNVPFVWAIREGDDESPDQWQWMTGLKKNVDGRGVLVKGWVPQTAILSHAAVGGFMTHCGWGSVTEAASAGVPMLTWPLFAEQFYNEVLVAEIAKNGAKIGAEAGFVWGNEDHVGVVMNREKIAERVIWFMGKDKEVEELRVRAKKLEEKARQAMTIDGSSYKGIRVMMEDMQQRNFHRTQKI